MLEDKDNKTAAPCLRNPLKIEEGTKAEETWSRIKRANVQQRRKIESVQAGERILYDDSDKYLAQVGNSVGHDFDEKSRESERERESGCKYEKKQNGKAHEMSATHRLHKKN